MMWVIEEDQSLEHLWLNCQLSQAPEIKVILIITNVIKSQSPEMERTEKTKAIVSHASHTRVTTKTDRYPLKLWW